MGALLQHLVARLLPVLWALRCSTDFRVVVTDDATEHVRAIREFLMDRRLHAIFDAVRECVLASGGDGDGAVISSAWRELADEFERYEAGRHFTTRHDCVRGESWITFSHEQEYIGFGPVVLPEGFDVVVVIGPTILACMA